MEAANVTSIIALLALPRAFPLSSVGPPARVEKWGEQRRRSCKCDSSCGRPSERKTRGVGALLTARGLLVNGVTSASRVVSTNAGGRPRNFFRPECTNGQCGARSQSQSTSLGVSLSGLVRTCATGSCFFLCECPSHHPFLRVLFHYCCSFIPAVISGPSGLLWAAGAFLAACMVAGIISVPLIC